MKYFFPILLVLLISCDQQTKSTEKAESGVAENFQTEGLEGCYQSIFGKDTSFLKIESLSGDSVSGTLSYHWFQKDRNDGSFTGVITDSKLIGFYDFASEGKNSIRQIAFKITSDTLTEGYGEIEMKQDTAIFKNISDLKYISQRPLVKIECQ